MFQVAIVDVDIGLVDHDGDLEAGGRAKQVEGDGTVECRFDACPLRPRQYVLRLVGLPIATSSRRTTSSPPGRDSRLRGQGAGVDSLADEEDGLVSMPFQFHHRTGIDA